MFSSGIWHRSFPAYYWDKFVKTKVIDKYKDTHDIAGLQVMLGEVDDDEWLSRPVLWWNFYYILPQRWLANIDFRYNTWKIGAILQDKVGASPSIDWLIEWKSCQPL